MVTPYRLDGESIAHTWLWLAHSGYPVNTHQNEFVGAARATELVEIRHEWPTTPLMSAEYEIALLGYRVVETSNAETVNFVVKGKQNGHVKWNDSDTAAFPGDTEASGENP